MTNSRPAIIAAALGLASGLTLGGLSAFAGGDKVVFPENWDKGVLYNTVDRYDVKQYRELWSTPAAVEAARKGEPIPSGTVLTLVQYKAQLDAAGVPAKDDKGRFIKGDLIAYTVMEKRTGWGAEYPADLRNGEWEYQAFTGDKKVNDKANLAACFQCHKPHEGQDFVISLAGLKGTAARTNGRRSAAGPGRREHCGFPVRPRNRDGRGQRADHLAQHRRLAASGDHPRRQGSAQLASSSRDRPLNSASPNPAPTNTSAACIRR